MPAALKKRREKMKLLSEKKGFYELNDSIKKHYPLKPLQDIIYKMYKNTRWNNFYGVILLR